MLLIGREDVDDPIYRLGSVLGVERGKDEMAGLGRGESDRDGFKIPHLADEDDVRVLTQHMPQRLAEALGVLVDLTLIDYALLVLVEEFYRVLDAQNVLLAGFVDLVYHSGERGGLAGAGRTRNQDQATRLVCHVLYGLGQPQLLKT